MKKNSTLIAIVFMAIMTVGFLTTKAQPWNIGGNAVGANSSFGTNTNFSVVFKTNNTDRGRITNGGNWAFGSAGTASKLTVNSLAGITPFRAQINGSSKLIVSGNGSVSVGSGTAGPTNGLYVAGSVGIGTASPLYKLQVIGNSSFSQQLVVGNGGAYGYNSGGPGVFGSGSGWGVYGTSPGYGVYGESTTGNYGVWGNSAGVGVLGTSSSGSYGVWGTSSYLGAYGQVTGTSGTNYGVYGYSPSTGGYGVFGSSAYIGVYGGGSSYGVQGTSGYLGVYGIGGSWGVYGQSSSGYGVFGISSTGVAGRFNSTSSHGVWGYTGSSTAYGGVFESRVFSYGGYFQSSDKSMKQNIQPIDNAMNIINQLQPKNYEFRTDGKFATMNLPKGKQYGLIAQEVQEVLPDLVSDAPERPEDDQAITPDKLNGKKPQIAKKESLKLKGINYIELIPLLIRAAQEQDKKIQELTLLVSKLTSQLNGGVTSGMASLGQNTPNPPVNNLTRITYSIPTAAGRSELIITDNSGKKIRQFVLKDRSGIVNVNTGSLSSGAYYYSLIVDGAIVDTKKLLLAR